MRCDQYLLSCDRKPANFAPKLPIFHCHSLNVGRIANLKAGGERAPKTAQSTYWSCYNMIRTQILNWSQICRNRKVGTMVRFQPGQKPTVLCPVLLTTCQDKSRSGFWTGLEPNRTEYPVQTLTAGVLPGPVPNTMHYQHIGNLYRQNRMRYSCCHVLKMSVNIASTIFGLVSKVIGQLFAHCYA